jgi:hypothetical protein
MAYLAACYYRYNRDPEFVRQQMEWCEKHLQNTLGRDIEDRLASLNGDDENGNGGDYNGNPQMTGVFGSPPAPVGQQGPPARAAAVSYGGTPRRARVPSY